MLSTIGYLLLAHSVQAIVLPSGPSRRDDDSISSAGSFKGPWKWADTQTVFSFGDSYTAEHFNTSTYEIGATFANGPNWIQCLTETYKVSSPIFRWNVAFGGANVDQDVIAPYGPGINSLKDQVRQFEEYVASGAKWDAEKSLCSVWIGINDISQTFQWTNVTFEELYQAEIDNVKSLVTRVQDLDACRAWMFLSMPPLGATPLWSPQAAVIGEATDVWNAKLQAMASSLSDAWNDTWIGVFDTGRVFTTLIDNGEALGFANVTGFNPLYPIQETVKQPGNNSQIGANLPMSSYLWLDQLHPTWVAHNLLAHAVATWLGAVNVVA